MRSRRLVAGLLAVGLLVWLPGMASAQEITGVARDNTGGVLPGVTVEVASPALIEQSRVVFTDASGTYRSIGLSAGVYSVTFSLPGFGTVITSGVELTADFTATINAEMSVGGIEETITVSGESPLVDVQAVQQQTALTSDVINELPTGRSFQNLAILVPGVQVSLAQTDVGGAGGAGWQIMEVHGSRGDQMPLLLNGMPFNNMNNTGGGYNHTLSINMGTIQEMTITTSGMNAEARVSGVLANNIAKEGSNQFTYYLYSDHTNGGMQSNNLSQKLKDQGLAGVNTVKEVTEINPAFGGPLVQDKLWLYAGYRYVVALQNNNAAFENKTPLGPQYCRTAAGCMYNGVLVPDNRDLTKQAFSGDEYSRTITTNLTWQASDRDKINFFWHLGQRYKPSDSSLYTSPEAATVLTSEPDYVVQAAWTNPLTNRVLLEGGAAFFNETWEFDNKKIPGHVRGYGPDATIRKTEQSTGTRYGSGSYVFAYNHQYNYRLAVNYVTGSHAFKIGLQDMFGTRKYDYDTNQAQVWQLNQGIPNRVTQYARQLRDHEELNHALGIYVQDRWTFNNVTVNAGIRYDLHSARVPEQSISGLLFVPSVSYPAIENAPHWTDLSPRIGVAWDVTGEGKSVLRVNYGSYLASESVATATANNPVNTRINSANRTWADANSNIFPDCNLQNTAANGECGAMSAPLGDLNIVTTYDPAILSGFGVRPNDQEFLIGFQQQLHPRVSLDTQWTWHSYGNFFATQNRSTPPSGYDPYCVTAPTDARLPGGGGNSVCGFMDINPSIYGRRPDNLVQSAANFGDVADIYTGVDVSITARLPNGGLINGGVSMGRERTNYCDVVANAKLGSTASTSAGDVGTTDISSYPSRNYCDVSPPYKPDFKGLITYPIGFGFNLSATWQNRTGPEQLGRMVAFNSNVTGLGRNLTQGYAVVNLIAPGDVYGKRVTQLDTRLTKAFNLPNGGRIMPTLAFYNLMNTNATLTWNNGYGPAYLTPTRIMQGRMVKLGVQLDF